MAEGGIGDVNSQRNSICELLKSSLRKGDAWFLLDMCWFNRWKKYVGYDSRDTSHIGDRSYHPGPIDNSALLKAADTTMIDAVDGYTRTPPACHEATARVAYMRHELLSMNNTAPCPPEMYRRLVQLQVYRSSPDLGLASKKSKHRPFLGGHRKQDSHGPQLKERLVDGLDYVMVPEKAWSDLLGWYGLVETQEPIKRYVIEEGIFLKHCKIEVYLMDLKLCKHPDLNTTITRSFSREATIGQLEQEMKHVFHIAGTASVRLWNRYMSNTYAQLSSMENTLQDSGLYQGQVIVVAQQNEDGSWPKACTFNFASVTPRIATKAADIQESSHVECTVCQELFHQPKLLPCGHTTCRKCLLSWLQTDGAGAGCPICRAAAVPSSRGNLSDLVDALPDDFAAMARVDSYKVLTGPHICSVCQGNVPASSYCFHCKVKLCSDCIIHHRKLPALMEHTVEDLGKLSEQRLAECWQVMCSSHPGRPAELFCSAHGDVICALCSSTAHRGCERLEVISDAAKQKRDELREQVGVLELRNERLTKEMASVKDKFKPMQGVLKAAFDDLHKQIDQQHLRFSDWLQKQENEVLTSMRPVETDLATVRYHTSSIKQVASSVPDGALLQMMVQLSTRLSDLEARTGSAETVKVDWTVSIDQQKLGCLKSDLSKMVTKKATK